MPSTAMQIGVQIHKSWEAGFVTAVILMFLLVDPFQASLPLAEQDTLHWNAFDRMITGFKWPLVTD